MWSLLQRAVRAQLSSPLPGEMSDQELTACLYQQPGDNIGDDYPLPEWQQIHQQLKRKGVTTPNNCCGRNTSAPIPGTATWCNRNYRSLWSIFATTENLRTAQCNSVTDAHRAYS